MTQFAPEAIDLSAFWQRIQSETGSEPSTSTACPKDVLLPFLSLEQPIPLSQHSDSLVRSQTYPDVTARQYPDLRSFVDNIQQKNSGGPASLFGFPSDPFAGIFKKVAASSGPFSSPAGLNVASIRNDFPILQQTVHGKQLVWFDNAATTQKPRQVIDALSKFYQRDNSNIHRGAHTLAARATDAYEGAREKVQKYINASDVSEIVFVRGTTEGINLVANSYGQQFIQPGDEIILSELEHHANIVPWQMMAKERGALLKVIPINDQGEVLLDHYARLLGPRTKIVALTQASNGLGTIVPIKTMIDMAHRVGVHVLIDGAQSIAHLPVDVQALDCDFFVFSGHKIFAPTGIGALYIKKSLQEILPPWQGGGSMIKDVTFESTTYSPPPAKFEAGTPNIADAVGLGAALDYVQSIGLSAIAAYEKQLLDYATEGLSQIKGLTLIGTAAEKVGVTSFIMQQKTVPEIGRYLDEQGIAVRAGHHCAQPSLRHFGLEATVRPSYSFYNTFEEIDRLLLALKKL